MGKIVAVSGVMKAEFCDEIVALTGKPNPEVLIVPTARYDHQESYTEDVGWFTKRECRVYSLNLFSESPSQKVINEKILNADIVYAPGGNTLNMMKIWRAREVDRVLRQAYRKGITLCGISAGANCWFKEAISGPFPSTLIFELPLKFLSELDIGHPWPDPGKEITQRLRQEFNRRNIRLSTKSKIYATLGFVGNSTGNLWLVSDEHNDTSYWIRKKSKKLSIYIPDKFMKVSGLGFIDTILGSHYCQRKEGVKEVMSKTRGVAIGLENRCALMIVDGQYRILSTDGDGAYKVFWQKGEFYERRLKVKDWIPVSSLSQKE